MLTLEANGRDRLPWPQTKFIVPGIVRRLEQDENEEQLIDDADSERESPEGRMRSQERPVRHDCHAQGYPEEQGCREAPAAVVLGVVLDRVFDDTDVYEAADEEEEDGEGVRAPEEGHALVVEIDPFFLLRPGKNGNVAIQGEQ